MSALPGPDPAYPLPRPEDDSRFTFGLAYDIARVLVDHGYPSLNGDDLVRLQVALIRFIYEAREVETAS